jgi:hypothetical protein
LLGHKRTLLKLSFVNVEDFQSVRRIIIPAADRNKKKQEESGVYEEVHQYVMIHVIRIGLLPFPIQKYLKLQ